MATDVMASKFQLFWQSLRRGLLVVFVDLILAASQATAGQQTASIIGRVTDESAGVLPGVTVTATSPALQLPEVTVVTDERGEYRLTPLPIGVYAVTYTLTGFQTINREEVRLTAGFTAQLDVVLKVGALEETVTVTGASPVVDARSTRTTTQLTRETLELTPVSRNSSVSLLGQAPGVRVNLDVGGSAVNAVPVFHAFGQPGESNQLVEGVAAHSSRTDSQNGQFWDYSALEEATVQTLGHDAEVPRRGIYLNVIFKSGGNNFHGNAFWAQTPPQFQSSNIDDALAAQGVRSGNPLTRRWDRSADLGGRIVRDKLWFYGALRWRNETREVLNAFNTDGSPATNSQGQYFRTLKLSYQLSASNRIEGYGQWTTKSNPGGISQFFAPESRSLNTNLPLSNKIEWQSVRGNSLFFALRLGTWRSKNIYTGYSDEVATFDQLTQLVTGLSTAVPARPIERRYEPKGSVTWHRPNLLGGSHEFKAGFGYQTERSDRQWISRGAAGNYRLVFRNAVPFQIDTYNYPSSPLTKHTYLDFYGQDSWTLARRLTLNLGLRYARDNGFVPAQCREAADPPGHVAAPASCFPEVQFKIWNPIVPRLRASYDVRGDGKTVIKGGWGRYAHMRVSDEVQPANRNVANSTTYVWHDLNNNSRYDSGEVDLDPNGPDFVATTLSSDAPAYGKPNPDEQEPITDEFSLSVERELIANFGVRATGVYSRAFKTYRLLNTKRPYNVFDIPITQADPGPDGRTGTADDPGTFLTYFDYPAQYAGIAFQEGMLINDPNATQTYKSVEMAASKRMSNGWQFMASYSATKTHDPFVVNVGGGTSAMPVSTFDPNAEIFSADNTWEWLGRASGAYRFPAGFLVSANFEHRSGNLFERTVSLRGGRQIPSLTVRAEPIGARRLPNINLLDLRVEKTVRLSARQKVVVQLNAYNITNINTVLGLTRLSGPNFLRPTSIAPPRTLELTASYAF